MKKDKKLLLVANVAKEHINKFHIPIIKEFKKQGWQVDVACSADDSVDECDHLIGMCWRRTPFSLDTVKGISQLSKFLRNHKYDIIYCHTPVGGLIARLAAREARKHGTKVIYCAHGFHFFQGAPLINWVIYYPMERILAHFCDAVFTVNEEDYNLAHRKFTSKARIVLVPEVGVNFGRLNIASPKNAREKYRKELGIDDNTTALIYVAELLPNKNQKMLVDTLKLLIDRGVDACLILPGPDHSDGELYEYVASVGLTDYVRLLGWRNDIGQLLYACDICTASSIREGFGINLVEAMYCGLPVIATNNRGHRMVIENGKNGFLVEINDIDSMANSVETLIRDNEIRQRFIKADVKKYDCNYIASQLYEKICEFV